MAFSLTGRIASPTATDNADTAPYATGQIIVGLQTSVPDALDLLLAKVQGSALVQSLDADGTVLISVPDGTDIPDLSKDLAALPYVKYAEPDYAVSIAAGEPGASSPIKPDCDLPPPWTVDTRLDTLFAADGQTITGYRETTIGPGFHSVVEYDARFDLVSSEYTDSSGYRSSTQRTTLTDGSGAVIGYSETSSGSGPGGYFYESVSSYDANFNVIEASYSDSSGFASTTTRSEIHDSAGTLTGYLVNSVGGGGEGGYHYSSTETFDANYQLLESQYTDSNGYGSTYKVETLRDSNGGVTGYNTTYTWTDGTGTFTSTNEFDADWNHIGGTFDPPTRVVDDGPLIQPVLALGSADMTQAAVLSAGSKESEVLDGSGKQGAKIKLTTGNDTVFVDDVRDKVVGTGRGEDTVISDAISLDLRRDRLKGIEDATLTGWKDLDLQGNKGANKLSGNAGDNRIDGGKGSDTLFGGLGDDTFVIRVGDKGAPDTITDFTSGEDTLALTGRALGKLFDTDGKLLDGVFGNQLLFDTKTGELSFDRDGAAGPHSAKVIAVLVGVSGLGADDFTHG